MGVFIVSPMFFSFSIALFSATYSISINDIYFLNVRRNALNCVVNFHLFNKRKNTKENSLFALKKIRKIILTFQNNYSFGGKGLAIGFYFIIIGVTS